MKLFDRIIERENEFVKYCDSYSNQNICLFGAGEGAFRIYKYLEGRDIPISKVAVNGDYLAKAKKRAIAAWGGVSLI